MMRPAVCLASKRQTLHVFTTCKLTSPAPPPSPRDLYPLVYHEHPGATAIVQRLGRIMVRRDGLFYHLWALLGPRACVVCRLAASVACG